jgi:hypothetical protein
VTEINPELTFTLDDAVGEVLALLTGLDLTYSPEYDRYRIIARQLNRAMRSLAVEHEWSFYSSTASLGPAVEGHSEMYIDATVRPRIINDDAVRLVNEDGFTVEWAYFLPRDAIYKYASRGALWAAVTRTTVKFSRPFTELEAGLDVQLPVMREPVQFRLPPTPESPADAEPVIPDDVRNQPIDFSYPDLVVLRAAYFYAQTDPIMQPRVQTLEAQYKDLMYQIIERDDRNTDSPYENEFFVPVQNGILGNYMYHGHPHADERRPG